MIELRTALLLAGIVLFVIILIVSYDKMRMAKRGPASRTLKRDRGRMHRGEPVLTPKPRDTEPEVPNESQGVVLTPREEDTEPARAAPETREPEPVPEPESEPLPGPEHDTASPPVSAEARDDVAVAVEAAVEADTTDMEEAEPEPEEGRQIDFVARLPGKNIIKRDTALGIYRQYEYELSKPHRIFGLSHPDNQWCDLEHEPDTARFTHFGLSLQLADRRGPVTESELNQFSQMVLRFSEVFGRRFKFSMTFEEALAEAAELDELSKKYDALAILNILSRDPHGFRGSQIDHAARELDMDLAPGRNIYCKTRPAGRGNRHLYSLANLFGSGEFDLDDPDRFRTNGVMLFINIPSTPSPGQVFNDMVDDAKRLCQHIDGKLVDQHKRGMTEKGLKHIAQQIRDIAAQLEKEGIVPGSDQAVRLF